MDSAITPPDVAAKPPNPAASLFSALAANLGDNSGDDAASGLFANLLSQIQTPAPPPPPPVTQTPPLQNANANNAGTANPAVPSTIAGNTTGSTPPSSAATPSGPAGWKLARHNDLPGDGQKDGHKGKSHSSDGKPQPTSAKSSKAPPLQTNTANVALSSAATTPPAVLGNNPLPSASGDQANTGANKGASAANAPAVTPTANSDPNDDASANANTDPAVTGASLAAATTTGDTKDTTGANNTGADGFSSELSMLLLQLSRLAARQWTDTAAANGTDQPATGQTAAGSPSASPATPASATGSKDKSDLKALLAEMNDQNGASGGNASDNASAAGAPNAATTDPSSGTLPQSSATTSSTTPPAPDAAKNAWMNADFFNLFNTPPPDPAGANAALVPVPNATALLSGAGNDGAAPDMDAGDGNGASTTSRNAAAADPAATPLTAGGTQAASPYDFASQLSALRTAKPGTTGLPGPVEQVIFQLTRAVKDGSSQMSIQLKPDDLGRIDIKLNVSSDGKVQGTVVADNPATLDLLLKDVRGLERALQEAGLRADSGSLQFSLAGGGGANTSFGQTAGGNSNYVPSGGYDAPLAAGTVLPVPASADGTETYYLTPGRVNLRV